MNTTYKQVTCIIYSCVGCIGVLFAQNEPETITEVLDRMEAEYEAMGVTGFYGQVVDSDGFPVEDAVVDIHWRYASLNIALDESVRRVHVTTDSNGWWNVHLNKALNPRLFSVECDGYYRVWTAGKDIKHATSPASREITVLRKIEQPTFLLKRRALSNSKPFIYGVIGEPASSNAWDIALDDYRKNIYADVHVTAKYNTEVEAWVVTYETPHDGDGLLASNEYLYEAPEGGYVSQMAYTNGPYPKYVYLRTRPSPVYSRMTFDYDFRRRPAPTNTYVLVTNFYIECKSETNPYGERSLEYDPRVNQPIQILYRLTDEARAALAKGEYPTKWDVEELRQELLAQ